jgi:membrane-bound lytic murein transglycosylase B
MRRSTLVVAIAFAFVAGGIAFDVVAQRTPDPKRGVPYGPRDDVRAFAAEVAAETGLDRRNVERWLAAARFQPQIVSLMSKPIVEPPKWFEYAPPFLSADRIAGGVAWWGANEDALERAEAK